MGIKATIAKKLSNEKDLLDERYKASKFSFVLSALLFFLNYFFVSAQFLNYNLFIKILPFSFIIFIVSLILFTYFSIRKRFQEKINMIFFIVILIILFIIGLALSTVFILPEELISNLI